MLLCGECKTPFPVYSALRDHFRTNHRAKFVAVCLWLGPERNDLPFLDSIWYYELQFTRVHPGGRVVNEQVENIQNVA
jgi:hypothetical protein